MTNSHNFCCNMFPIYTSLKILYFYLLDFPVFGSIKTFNSQYEKFTAKNAPKTFFFQKKYLIKSNLRQKYNNSCVFYHLGMKNHVICVNKFKKDRHEAYLFSNDFCVNWH